MRTFWLRVLDNCSARRDKKKRGKENPGPLWFAPSGIKFPACAEKIKASTAAATYRKTRDDFKGFEYWWCACFPAVESLPVIVLWGSKIKWMVRISDCRTSLLKDPASPRDFRLLPNTSNKPKIQIDWNLFISMFTAKKIQPSLIWASGDLTKSWSKKAKTESFELHSAKCSFVPWLQSMTGHVGKDGSAITSAPTFPSQHKWFYWNWKRLGVACGWLVQIAW